MKAALTYAQRLGWAVIPLNDVTRGSCSCGRPECPSAGKHPRLKEWQKIATADAGQVAEWIARYPAANVGVATGEASGFFVLDVDPDHGGDETLAAIVAEHGPLPVTPEQETGSGGRHYAFKLPGFAVTNKASGVLGKGLDVRGNGGQIVVAPSRSLKGAYRWILPPWSTPIADAPTWLLERLSRAPAPSAAGDGSSTERGFFPAATPAVLRLARATLLHFGPATDGEGGGLKTVQAAAILTHDFALTDEEAWPLLVEWNEICLPPWEPDGLRTMLGRGRKYGKAEFGCKRTLDGVARVKKALEDWRTAGAREENKKPLIEFAREVCSAGIDPADREEIERELMGATGHSKTALALPKVRPAVEHDALAAGTIEVTPKLAEVADAATMAIRPDVYQRNGVLCEVVKAERTFISDLETPRIQDLMSRRAIWVRVDPEEGPMEQPAPMPVAAIIHSRRTHKGVSVLESVTTAPIFLSDGSILQTRGYNAEARVYLEPSVQVQVAEHPGHADAVAAVDMFRDVLQNFAFATEADFSCWLASLLSPLVKSATLNAPSPLLCVSASSPGAGKTLLSDVLAQIVTGSLKAEVSPYNPRDAAEWAKKLTAFVKAASPVRVLDNCNGPIGDEGLDRLITSSTWSDRILGVSEAPPMPNVTTWIATGNNIEPTGDTVRRVMMCRIEVMTERPQERSGFKYDLEGEYALEHRAELLSAALTILRAYHMADRPSMQLPSWGSFTTWSNLVRNAIVWAGEADPFLTQRRAAAEFNEPDNEAHDFWINVLEACPDGHAGSIVGVANQRDAAAVLGLRDQVTSFTLKKFVNRFVDRVRRGKRIRRDPSDRNNQARYYVETVREG